MTDKPLADRIAALSKVMETRGLNALARLLFRVAGDRSTAEHEKWDRSRDKAQNAAIESVTANIHTTPQAEPEIAPDVVREIDSLPPVALGNADTIQNPEVAALEATGAIRREGGRLWTSDPMRFLSGFVALCADKSTWIAFSRQRGTPGLYADLIEPVATRLKDVLSYDNVLKLSCQVSRVYGVRVRTVPVSEVYRSAPAFVENARMGMAMTLSTSSGVIDPLERAGTEDVLDQLGIPRDSEVAKKFGKKDAWRIINFRDGLLSPAFDARRPYFFDRKVTAKAMQDTLAVIPDQTGREKYKNMAASNLADALTCKRFELYEVAAFENWMWRYTRSSAGHALISIRHPQTKSIAEGIEIRFTNPERRHRWFQGVFGFAEIAASLGNLPPLAIAAIAAALQTEELLYDHIDTHVLRKEAESDMLRCSKPVVLPGATPTERQDEARRYIDSLLRQKQG